MSFVTHAQNKDASAFKSLVEEKLAEKVVMVLDGLKAEVASDFFNTVSEEGGVSGGVAKVWKKPTPPADGEVTLPGSKENKSKEGGIVHAGRSNSSNGPKTGEGKLPGEGVSEAKKVPDAKMPKLTDKHEGDGEDYRPQVKKILKTVKEGRISNEPNQPALRIKKTVQHDKKPHLSSKAEHDRASLKPKGAKD